MGLAAAFAAPTDGFGATAAVAAAPNQPLLLSLLFLTILGVFALLLLRLREQRRNARHLKTRLAAQERELGRKHRFLEGVLGNATDGLLATDLSGRIMHANPAVERLHGRPLRGENLVDIARSMTIRHKDGTAVPFEQLPQFRVVHGGDPEEAVAQTWIIGGERRDLRVSGHTLRDAEGERSGAVFTFIDVTSELRIQNALKSSKSLLEVLLDAIPAGILAFDAEGRITLMNRGARELLEITESEPPIAWPKTCRFVSRDGKTPLGQTNHPVVRALAGFDLRGDTVLLLNGHNESGQFVRINTARVDGAASATGATQIHTVMVMVDVTLDEQRHQQIERASRLDALGQLTSGIAHDFNNLLSAMLGAVQLAMIEDDSEKRKRHHRIAIRSMHRGSELTRRLMSFANAQPGQPVAVAVKPLLQDFLRLAERTIVASIRLKLEIDDAALHVYCDKGQLETAVLNLVLNARDAILRSGEGDTITIRARAFVPSALPGAANPGERRANEFGEITVEDNGPGMTQEVRRRAVDPFFSTKQGGAGAGLGLSIVASFVQQSGGFFKIESDLGHGTKVSLSIPQAMPWLAGAEPEQHQQLIDGCGQKILIVEDEDDLREVTFDLISRLGFEAHAACSGPEAEAFFAQGGEVDAVLTDIVMPGGMNGFELAERMRKRDPEMPLVYMSGYAGMAASDRRGRVGAPLIRKPCSIEDLSSALRTVLRQN